MRAGKFRQSEIAAVIQRGRKVHARHSWLKWSASEQRPGRLAFAISRRMVRSNVKRNLIKRQHREAARIVFADARRCDVVVFAKPGVASLSRGLIRDDALTLWKKLKSSSQDRSSG